MTRADPPGRVRGGGGLQSVTRARPRPAIATATPTPPGPEAVPHSIYGPRDSGLPCGAPGCTNPLPGGRRRFCSDLCRVRGQRAERVYDAEEVGAGVIRMIGNVARRAGGSDLGAFGVLWEVRAEADRACAVAIDGLRARGYSWSEIAAEAGLSRQGVTQWRQRRPAQCEGNDQLRGDAP